MKHPELDEFTDKVKADLSCIKAKLETRYGNYRKALVHYDKALSKKEGHLFLRKEIESIVFLVSNATGSLYSYKVFRDLDVVTACLLRSVNIC